MSSCDISVVIPVYGKAQADFLPEAVDSVLAQTCQDFEIVLVAGGVEGEQAADRQKEKDARISVLHGVVRGLSDARNRGIENAWGRWIVALDADDTLRPRYLECLAQAIGEDPYAISSCNPTKAWWVLEPDGYAKILERNALLTSSMFTRTLWKVVGGYEVSILGYEDWAFWISCSKFNPTVTILPDKLFERRVHADSMTQMEQSVGADRYWKAMIRIRYPHLYPKANLYADCLLLRSLPLPLVNRLRKRVEDFPENKDCRAFLDLVEGR